MRKNKKKEKKKKNESQGIITVCSTGEARPDQAVSSITEGETQWKNPTPKRPMCLLQEDWPLEE
jgi:hypothetical protein